MPENTKVTYGYSHGSVNEINTDSCYSYRECKFYEFGGLAVKCKAIKKKKKIDFLFCYFNKENNNSKYSSEIIFNEPSY